MSPMYKILHYRDKCIGCGVCQEMQPALWRMSKKDGKATLVRGLANKGIYSLYVSDSQHDKQLSMDTARACPVRVIKVF